MTNAENTSISKLDEIVQQAVKAQAAELGRAYLGNHDDLDMRNPDDAKSVAKYIQDQQEKIAQELLADPCKIQPLLQKYSMTPDTVNGRHLPAWTIMSQDTKAAIAAADKANEACTVRHGLEGLHETSAPSMKGPSR